MAALISSASASALTVAPGVALAGPVAPDSAGSGNADAAMSNYVVILVLGAVGLLALIVVLARALRAGGDDVRGDAPGPGLQRNAIAGAALLATVIAVFALISYDDAYTPEASGNGALQTDNEGPGPQYTSLYRQPRDLETPKGPSMTVNVNGQRYLWRYDYNNIPGQTPAKPLFSYHDLIVPEDTTILLHITSSDVTHSWWVPELGGKFDAIPGYVNTTWFKVDEPGVYEGACAEICGANHSEMTNRVRVLPVDEFTAWAESQTTAIQNDRQALKQSIEQRSKAELPQGLKSAVNEE